MKELSDLLRRYWTIKEDFELKKEKCAVEYFEEDKNYVEKF